MNRILLKKHTLITAAIFVVMPLYSLPLILRAVLCKKEWAFFMFSLFMGLVGILWPPTGDLYRYTDNYYMYKYCNWNNFIDIIQFKFDYVLPFLSYVLARLNLPFDLSRFFFNFLGYYFLSRIMISICKHNPSFNDKKSYLYALIILIPLSFSTYLFRYSFSTILFVYGSYLINYEFRKNGYLFVALACLNHFSYVVFLPLLFATKLNFLRFNKMTIIMMFIVSFMLSGNILVSILDKLPISDQLLFHLMNYFDGYWSQEYLNDHSLKYKIMTFLFSFLTYIYYWGYIATYDKKANRQLLYVNSFILFTLIVAPFSVVYERFLGVSLLIMKVHYLYYYDSANCKMVNFLRLFAFCAMFATLLNWWSVRRELSISEESCLLYSTSVQILFHSYDKNWINDNIMDDGNLVNNN